MEIGFFSLVSILPEIILIIGGLLILLLDATAGKRRDSGQGYMVISVLFLLIGLIGVVFQFGAEPQVALYMVAIDPFALFVKLIVYGGMLLVAVAGGGYLNKHIGARG